MTCIIFTPNLENYSILKLPQDYERQQTPSNPSKVVELKHRTNPNKHGEKSGQDDERISSMLEDIFVESALQAYWKLKFAETPQIIDYMQETQTVTLVENKVRLKEVATKAFSALSKICKAFLTKPKGESDIERRAKARLSEITRILGIDANGMGRYSGGSLDALYDEFNKLSAIIQQEEAKRS